MKKQATCQKEKLGLWKHSEVKAQIMETEWALERNQADQAQTDSYGSFHSPF